MNSAPQVETHQLSDADLDGVSGGLLPQVAVSVDSTTLSSAGLVSQLGAVQGEALGALGQSHQVGVAAAL